MWLILVRTRSASLRMDTIGTYGGNVPSQMLNTRPAEVKTAILSFVAVWRLGAHMSPPRF